MKYYIRFGLWPENERSGVGEGYRRIYGGPAFEQGVSVYAAEWDEAKQRWVIDDETATFTFHATLSELLYDERDIYLVTGDEVDDEGTDGEPLLRNLKTIKKLKVSDIYNREVYDVETIMYEEESPVKKQMVLILHKPPHQSPVLKEIEGSLEAIHEIVGRNFSWVNLGNDVFMLTNELPYGLEPNFMMAHKTPDPETLAKLKLKFKDIPISGGTIEDLLAPPPEMIFGDVLFLKIKIPEPDEVDFDQYPWPWSEEMQKEYDENREVPVELEFSSLSEDEVRDLEVKLGDWAVRKRIAIGQPKIILDLDVTHFVLNNPQDLMNGDAILFKLDICEACDSTIMEPNSMRVFNTRRELLFFGLKELPSLPPEGGWSEEFEGVTCGCI